MESGEAGPVTLQLKQKTKHHAKTAERKANVPSGLLRDVLRYTKHLSISTHMRHICYLCKGNNCGFGFLWFGISCIPEESQVTEISSVDFMEIFPVIHNLFLRGTLETSSMDLQKSHLTYKKNVIHEKVCQFKRVNFLSFYFFLKGTFLPDCLAETTCLPSAINPLLRSNYS